MMVALMELYPRVRPVDEETRPGAFRRIVLGEVRASASRQFSEKGLKYIVDRASSRSFVVVDLRREYHGFVNGYAISWKIPGEYSYNYNHGLRADAIEAEELSLLARLAQGGTISCRTNTDSMILSPEHVCSERQLAERLGVSYVRVPVIEHGIPEDHEVDVFVELVRSMRADTVLHFHCAGGAGRTTAFTIMLEMIRNSESRGPDEIVRRHEALGGSNLWDPSIYEDDGPEAVRGATERLEFLLAFHQYNLENPDAQRTWSAWRS